MTMAGGPVSDDHLPFIARGVETLHVIPQPFPAVWHKMEDDAAHLDAGVVSDWARIVAGFVLEWLDMMEVWDGDTEITRDTVLGEGSQGG
jgi:glutaminyl-peptide cyclotransferase